MKSLPPQDLLLTLFDYRDGELIHKTRPDCGHPSWNRKFADKRAGKRMKNGYINITIFNRCFYAHRIIWKLVTGRDPGELDHINRDRTDNRFENLREVTHQQNGFNHSKHRNNQSGVKGVHLAEGRWIAQLAVGKRHMFLGRFPSLEAATHAYREAVAKYHGEFGCHG